MRQFDSGGPRAQGPAVVWAGLDQGPALVVIDPAGEATHAEVPATWRPLAERFQIAWCRVPATGESLRDVEDVLETLAQDQTRADLVVSGLVSDGALALAALFDATVRSVLLVNPGPVEPGDQVRAAGVRSRIVAHSEGGDQDREEPPIPLGHPDVVAGVITALADADRQPWPDVRDD
ncbi:hypothetical protein LWC34_29925 [Kibdelosporangium philippinense]|uniref:Alpha/beta hydrolase n=1 Tax=Kibdelosporangium philippinense TaxID=211113 RepID=A0ABS8ZMJ2_9PSEU|nr:hypothetical protein [Kibdelosporangium philippinense]MCE7007017.1 hypothetical protein [Kibdelosporangium philippinense]